MIRTQTFNHAFLSDLIIDDSHYVAIPLANFVVKREIFLHMFVSAAMRTVKVRKLVYFLLDCIGMSHCLSDSFLVFAFKPGNFEHIFDHNGVRLHHIHGH